MTDTETYDGYPNRETWTVSLVLNNDQDWQSYVLSCLRRIDWDTALAGMVILVDAENLKRVRARHAGTVVRDALETLLAPRIETAGLYRAGSDQLMELTERQLQVIRDIGSLWRVDWFYLGQEFLTILEEA